ncbi:hypothetical protein L198_02922 [Cryptococcus wingfieldii CBS 7118]|uniref:DSBA-like thioredoxin domain-containing protein n=1 Tax=Cryptococcus wingfieldii CBS 7118 TaxID=1295528 RepID=A0A1E3JKZ6_9TREE|nr:hypothetical protein L198_02922 [Cryptococcus wingfieldii CBS 7118]ODO00602.1 hypothetical protein L198_02922 [Cryptococcus wingfieldii CBS 7118]
MLFSISITSDVICPFCLIGVKQLLGAIDEFKSTHPDAKFDLRLLPFELTPGLSEEPKPKRAMYEAKFGKERSDAILAMLPEKYAAVGETVDLDGQISSTHHAHRLQTLALCRAPEAQLPLAMEIFRGYHSNGKHPSDKAWLASLAVKHGIFPTEGEAREYLDSNKCDKEVRKAYDVARETGVTGVPYFVFQGKFALSGAIGQENFLQTLEEVARRETVLEKNSAPAINSAHGESCTDHCEGDSCAVPTTA